MRCEMCGSPTQGSGVARCSACQARWEGGEASTSCEGEEPPRVQERLHQIVEAVDRFRAGQWTRGELGSFLGEVASLLEDREREIRQIQECEIPEEAQAEFLEEFEMGFAGIALYNEGLVLLMEFAASGEESLQGLEAGLDRVRQGNEAINMAMRINRENRQKLEELHSDSSTLL